MDKATSDAETTYKNLARMPKAIDRNEPNTDTVRLDDWRSASRGQRLPMRIGWVVVALLFVSIAMFFGTLLRPWMHKPMIVASIGPLGQTPARRFYEFAEQLASVQVKPFVTIDGTMDRNPLGWLKDVAGDQPVLIHAVGVCQVHRDRAFLSGLDAKSAQSPGGLDVRSMLADVADATSPIVLVIEVVQESKIAIGGLPEIDHWRFEQCLRRDIKLLGDAPVAVVLHSSQVNRDGIFHDDFAKRLESAFSQLGDPDANRSVTASEFLAAIAPKGSSPATRLISGGFSSRFNSVHLFPPAKTLPTVTEESETAAPTSVASNDEPPEPAAGVGKDTTVKSIDAIAPSLPLAVKLHRLGIQTQHSENAEKTIETLKGLIQTGSNEAESRAFIDSPEIIESRWDEVTWMRQVLPCDAPWELRRKLIRCRLLANQLAIRDIVRDQLGKQFNDAQVLRRQAERSLLSPVRADYVNYVDGQVRQAIDRFEQLASHADCIERANRLVAQTCDGIPDLLSSPVQSRRSEDDSVCQHLQLAADLQSLVRQGDLKSGPTCHWMADSLEKHLAKQADSPSRSPWANMADLTMSETSLVRIARSKIAAEVLMPAASNSSGQPSSAQQVADASDQLSKILLGAGSIPKQLDHGLSKYQTAIRSFRATSSSPTTGEAVAETSHWDELFLQLATDTVNETEDAVSTQWDSLQWSNQQLRRIGDAFGVTEMARLTLPNAISIRTTGSLTTSGSVRMDAALELASESSEPGHWEIELDRSQFRLAGTSHPVGASHPEVERLALGSASSVQFAILPANESQGPQGPAAIDLRWIDGTQISRVTVPIETSAARIVEVTTATPTATSPIDGQWAMHANRADSRQIAIRSLGDKLRRVQVRIIGWTQKLDRLPDPTEEAKYTAWLSSIPSPTVLASHAEIKLSSSTDSPVPLKALKPTPPIAAMKLGTIACEVTDLDRKLVEVVDLNPVVIRPASLVAPELSYNSDSRMVTLTVNGIDDTASNESQTHIQLAILNDRTQESIAHTTFAVSPRQTVTKRLSVSDNASGMLIARILVDGWPSAFTYRFPSRSSQTNILPNDEHAPVHIVAPSGRWIADGNSEDFTTQVWVDLSDHIFRTKSDTLKIGLDINGDRYLDNEPSVTASGAVSVAFRFAGVNDRGEITLANEVTPRRIEFPLPWIINKQVDLIATLTRGETVTYSDPVQVIFDQEKPIIHDVQWQSPLPALLGKPIDLRVTIDDAGLSGTAGVVAAWSMDGSIEISSAAAKITGTLLVDGTWAIKLPTDALASGTHPLLIQAVDAAGNASEIKVVSVEVLSQQQLASMAANQISAVRGKVTFVERPVGGMTVSISRSKDPNQSLPPEHLEVTTGDDGSFVFPGVKPGDYEVQVKGLYRGMRREKAVRISVRPPTPTMIPSIRLD